MLNHDIKNMFYVYSNGDKKSKWPNISCSLTKHESSQNNYSQFRISYFNLCELSVLIY